MGQERIAVMQFEGSGVDEITARNITKRFSYELSKTKRFDIVEREMMDRILEEQKFQLDGYTEETLIRIGKILGAQPGYIEPDIYALILDFVGTDAYGEMDFDEYLEKNDTK